MVDKKMKIITLHQPWATLIKIGWKTIETRTHDKFTDLKYKRIGIHAGLEFDNDWKEKILPYLSQIRQQTLYNFNIEKIAKLQAGYILCTAYVEDTKWLPQERKSSQQALIDCEHTKRFGLLLSNIMKIKPQPAKGKQGIWEFEIK